MKDGIKKIVGKRISGFVVRKSLSRNLRTHLFLIFSDGTYFELWATGQTPGELLGCADIDKGGLEEVRNYTRGMESILEAFDGSVGK